MTNYRSLIGGYFSDNTDKSLPVAIRFNNPGAVNSAAWEKIYPGYVGEQETTPGNHSSVFETPEHGVAVWYELMKKYRAGGHVTIEQIITRYGGGQNYAAYVDFVVKRTGMPADEEVVLNGDVLIIADQRLLQFAKAMFRYEAGRETPLSDAQILYGFKFARERASGVTVTPGLELKYKPSFWGTLAKAVWAWLFTPKPVTKIPLPGEIPSWLATMREITGTLETPGDNDNPVIMAWRNFIATSYPDMKAYCALYNHDNVPWCGLTIAYVLAKNGIRPRFGATATDKFLWANSWAGFGTKLDKPRLGAIMVFTRNGGGHVSLYEGEDEHGYIIRGGNQNDSVNVTHMSRDKLSAIVWPPIGG